MIPSGRRSLVVPSCGGVTPCRSPAKVPRSGVIWLDATAFCDQGLGRGLSARPLEFCYLGTVQGQYLSDQFQTGGVSGTSH
jgi:hypothetical protein